MLMKEEKVPDYFQDTIWPTLVPPTHLIPSLYYPLSSTDL